MNSISQESVFWPRVKNSQDLSIGVGYPPAKISVRNLQAIIRVGKDAWGRKGKVQPILISATVSLRQPFNTASTQDAVNKDTVHYGTLSNAILEAAQEFHDRQGNTVKRLIRYIEYKLAPPKGLLLNRRWVASLELEITLPKALLNSTTGVSRISTVLYDEYDQRTVEGEYWGMSLVLRNLQVSTLIGVNPNERLAKQLVIANIELDVSVTDEDIYNELEEIAVKTIEESSFQTLESLASHLAWRIARYFVYPHFSKYYEKGIIDSPLIKPSIKISLSKPTAVTMADAPVVEVLVNSKNLLLLAPPCSTTLPFPLQGRLDEWMKKHDIEGFKKDPVLGGTFSD